MDAITLLKNDHKTVEQLFKRYEQAGDNALVEKRHLVDRIIEELSIHAAVEEQLFYPAARSTVPDTEDIALESIEEHHIVKWELSELEDMDPSDERFDAKVTVLMENVRHHVEEEETDFFPKVREELGRNALNDLGDAMVGAKKLAPTHPHPMAPDTPPGNLVAGFMAGAKDRLGDAAKGVAQGAVTAGLDLFSRVTGNNEPKASPTGSTVARKQAQRVRSTASDATDKVIDTAKTAESKVEAAADTAKRTATTAGKGASRTAASAKNGATRTAKAARSGAKGTATSATKSARSSAKATTTTAKRAATTTRRTAASSAKSTARTAKKAASTTKATAKA
ncbi:hypothetical protein BH10ACT3_BH10ACT3_04790 [soil metagenome]